MPKKFLQRFSPNPDSLKNHKHLKMFGSLLHAQNLWLINRRSIPGAFAIGLFSAWIPIPFQMVLAAALAITFRVNVPVAVGLVWITNPVTMPVMFYGAYLLGASILGIEARNFDFQLSWEWLSQSLSTIGPSFLLGCGILAMTCATLGYFFMQQIWRLMMIRKWRKRHQK